MSKQIIFSIFIMVLSVSILHGQKRLSRITFKDGTVVNGFAKFLEEGRKCIFLLKKKANM